MDALIWAGLIGVAISFGISFAMIFTGNEDEDENNDKEEDSNV